MSVRVVNLGEFLKGLDQESREVEKLVSLTTQRISLGILSRLVLASPVDTGRFRGNWQVDIGRDPLAELEGADKSGAGTISRGAATIKGAAPFREVIIANNLPYGPRLNDGWSRQAPAGFVEAAVDLEARVFA